MRVIYHKGFTIEFRAKGQPVTIRWDLIWPGDAAESFRNLTAARRAIDEYAGCCAAGM